LAGILLFVLYLNNVAPAHIDYKLRTVNVINLQNKYKQFKDKIMEKCYEYLGCDKFECIMYGKTGNTKCWEVDATLCNHPGMELFKNKALNKCEYCIYYVDIVNPVMNLSVS